MHVRARARTFPSLNLTAIPGSAGAGKSGGAGYVPDEAYNPPGGTGSAGANGVSGFTGTVNLLAWP